MLTQTQKKEPMQIELVTPLLETPVSIIIPAFNEEKRIGRTIKELVNNMPSLSEIIVTFDGTG